MPKKLPGGDGKRVPLNMRTTRERRDLLVALAQAEGRSLAQTVERIVDMHFDSLQQASNLRVVIREEIRSALDIKDARALGVSIAEHPLASDLRVRIAESGFHHPV